MGRGIRTGADRDLLPRVTHLLSDLVAIPAVSGQEDAVRAYVLQRLRRLGVSGQTDAAGNVIALVPGSGERLLLNAHMDRVPPGLGLVPRIVRGRMLSDGTTNLGADDTAGIAVILLAVEEALQRALVHPPLVLLFTVGEEVGLLGASAFDPSPWQVERGIVFDNAGAAGDVVTRASSYIAFDATLGGTGGHPGKDLSGTLSAIEILRAVELPLGAWDDGLTRVSIGTIQGGTARNAIAAELRLAGEVRTLAQDGQLDAVLAEVERRLADAAARTGGTATVTFEPHGAGYELAPDEPLLATWRAAWLSCGHSEARGITSYIGSDANALRQHLRVFTISTGVEDEHTVRESIALAPLARLVQATLALFATLAEPDRVPR